MKNYRFFSVIFLGLFLCGCNLNAKEKNPYIAYAEMTLEDSTDYDVAGLSLYVLNKSEKEIEDFTLVFYVYDSDGVPPQGMDNNIVMNITCPLDPGESIEFVIKLDDFMNYVPEEPYQIDYLYLSKISYSDGTSWTDPLGIKSF